MPDLTPRVGIKKPLGSENVTRQSFNDNWDIIDAMVATIGSDGKVPSNQLPESVPYTGAAKDLDMNGKAILNMDHLDLKGPNTNGHTWRLIKNGSSGKYELRLINDADGSIVLTPITVTDSGTLNVPFQSYVDMSTASTQSIASGVDTRVTNLTLKTSDNQNEFTSNRFTAKETGVYNARIYADWNTTVPTVSSIAKIYKNGAFWGNVAVGAAERFINGSAFIYLASGDYIDIYAYQDSAGTAKTLAGLRFQIAKSL